MNDFEDDKESEFISDNANIESLLEQLDGEEPTQDSTQNCSEPRVLQTLDGVIDILQNVGIQKIASPISTVVGNVTSKPTKFLGIGTKQLQLDAGQKKFGIVDCKDCGLHYNVSAIIIIVIERFLDFCNRFRQMFQKMSWYMKSITKICFKFLVSKGGQKRRLCKSAGWMKAVESSIWSQAIKISIHNISQRFCTI